MRTLFFLVLVFAIATDNVKAMEGVAKAGAQIQEAFKLAKDEVDKAEEKNKNFKDKGVDKKEEKSSDHLHLLFSDPKRGVEELAKQANIEIQTLKELINLDNISPSQMKSNRRFLRAWRRKFASYCSREYTGIGGCNEKALYRTANGTCNNLRKPTWGSVFCPQQRFIPPMYDDTVDSPRKIDGHGYPLPSPRLISNIVHRNLNGTEEINSKLTVMVMQFGQFIDHEFISTPLLKGKGGTTINCCGPDGKDRPECLPIEIPAGDPFFKGTCMNFVRSAPAPNKDCNPGFREQINQVTSFIDGSAVYGSNDAETANLRSYDKGQLKTSPYNLLPKADKSKCVLKAPKDYCQLAGDARVNVVPSLGFSHTLFLREHNRLALTLHSINPHWDDETLFQQARKIIAAEEMHVTYNEYLPSFLNNDTMNKYKLWSAPTGLKHCYRKKVNPSIANVFGVAAFRFGHSQIPNFQKIFDMNFKTKIAKPIEDTYHNPNMMESVQLDGFDGLGAWLTTDSSTKVDRIFEDGNRDKLFMDVHGNSFDLPALNIMRGRDHGIPTYNHWRLHCHLSPARHFHTTKGGLVDHETHSAYLLEKVYTHTDDIDLFTGAISEKHMPGANIGPTFACLIAEQFKMLKFGDRFWYENRFAGIGFTKEQVNEIKKMSLAKVLCDNTHITKLQPQVMYTNDNKSNKRINCDNIPGIDLTKWKACERASSPWPQFNLNKCKPPRRNKN